MFTFIIKAVLGKAIKGWFYTTMIKALAGRGRTGTNHG